MHLFHVNGNAKKMVVNVVKRYAVREAEKWRYAVRKAKIGRYAVRKGVGGVTSISVSPNSNQNLRMLWMLRFGYKL